MAQAPPKGHSSRLAGVFLLLLVAAMPLVPFTSMPVAKHAVWLALAALGMGCVWFEALAGPARRVLQPALGTPVDIALGAFLASSLPAAFKAANPGASRYELGLLLATGLTYVLAVKAVRSPADVRRIYAGALLAGTVISVFGLLGYRGFLLAAAPEVARSEHLSTPFFAHSYLAAQYLVMIASGGLVVMLEERLGTAARIAVGAGLLAVLAFLLVIGSRGAYLALAVALGTHLALRLRAAGGGRHVLIALLRRGAVGLLAGGAALVLLAAADLLPGALTHALDRVLLVLDPQASSLNFSRLEIWRDTLRMAADHLILGVGPGGFDTSFPRYHVSTNPVPHAHDQFLNVLAETGLLGLVALLFLWRHAAHTARRGAYVLAADEERRTLYHAGVAALVAAATYCIFETPLRWAEAGSLVMVALAVVSRAGCTTRDRPGRPLVALAGLAVAATLLGIAWPAWTAYGRASLISRSAIGNEEDLQRLFEAGDTPERQVSIANVLAALSAADEAWPWRADFVALQADILTAQGRLEQALAAARIADQRVPGSFRHQQKIGLLLMRLARPAEAIVPLRGAISAWQGPEAIDAYVLLGRAYYMTRHYEEAWLVCSDLLARTWHHARPEILLDSVRCLLNLDRNLRQARTMLADYTRRAGPEADAAYVARLRSEIDAQMVRERRPRGL